MFKSFISVSSLFSFTLLSSFPSLPVNAQSSSGCGDKSTAAVLSILAPVSSRQFHVACKEHDACYDTPRRSKQDCDKAFRNRMLEICARDHNTIFGRPLKIACNGRADAFYSAVNRYGQSSYDAAQRKAIGNYTANPGGSSQFSTISFKNNCPHPTQIAVYFLNPSNQWQTKAWYSFVPNEGPARLNGIETRNRYIYYYAETIDDSNLVWTGNLSSYINDRLYDFQEIDTGSNRVRWTQTLSCPQASIPSVFTLAQASKQPTENQLPPDELPPIVPDPQQTQDDQPKNQLQQSPSTSAPVPSKGDSDSAQPVPPSDSSDPSPFPVPSPEQSPNLDQLPTPEQSPAPSQDAPVPSPSPS